MFFCLYLAEKGWFHSIYIDSSIHDAIGRVGWITSELMYNFDMLTHTVMSLNRFSAVHFPTKYEKVSNESKEIDPCPQNCPCPKNCVHNTKAC